MPYPSTTTPLYSHSHVPPYWPGNEATSYLGASLLPSNYDHGAHYTPNLLGQPVVVNLHINPVTTSPWREVG